MPIQTGVAVTTGCLRTNGTGRAALPESGGAATAIETFFVVVSGSAPAHSGRIAEPPMASVSVATAMRSDKRRIG